MKSQVSTTPTSDRARCRPSGIEDAIVEELNLVFAEQMRTDLLEPLRGDQFARQPLLIVQVIAIPAKRARLVMSRRSSVSNRRVASCEMIQITPIGSPPR